MEDIRRSNQRGLLIAVCRDIYVHNYSELLCSYLYRVCKNMYVRCLSWSTQSIKVDD